MRDILAERILLELMNWSPETVSEERYKIQTLANFKYNEYQQFKPGIRFIESLTRWLSQFTKIEEKKIAYEYIVSNLIFISNIEISHLINSIFPDFIRKLLIVRTSEETNIDLIKINKILGSKNYRKLLRQSLFIGLSDGSRIDQFRRCNNSCLSHEQVYLTYQIKDDIQKDMINELRKSLNRDFDDINKQDYKFKFAFLLDDFSASGKSFFRKENNEYKGKIFKFLNNIFFPDQNKNIQIFDISSLEIHIIFYVATKHSINYLNTEIKEWFKNNNIKNKFSVQPIQLIDEEKIKSKLLNNKKMIDILKNYFDDSILTDSFKKGKHDFPYMGFNECGIPLVLNHNTPNNSIPLIWFEDDRKIKGLFPRINRHKE